MGHQFFIKVHEDMPDHPKVEPLSDKAFRLLVETWCWCKRLTNDGRMTKASWIRRGTARARAELEKAGLVDVDGDTVLVHDYLDWQTAKAAIEAKQEAIRAGAIEGNHKRWHVARSVVDPACPLCTASGTDRPTDSGASRPPIGQASPDRVAPESTEAEAEAEAEAEGGRAGSGRPAGDAQRRPPDRCPKHRNTDSPPPCGACADARRQAQSWDADAGAREAEQRAAIRKCRWCDPDGWRLIDPAKRYLGPRSGPEARCDHAAPVEVST